MECVRRIQLKTGELVPCGKCYACLSNQRSEWIFRLQQEYLASISSIFITLTYDDEHIPKNLSVSKRDIQLFNKRLRKHFPSNDLRFYLVSEYGDRTFRPHYHGLYFFKTKYDDKFIYDAFTESWQNGFIKFGEVNEARIVYATKYCLKHSHTPKGCLPTFRLVSKMNGGIGYIYLDKMSDYHKESNNYQFVSHGGKTCRMPRYYRVQLGYKCPDRLAQQDELYTKISDDFRKRYSAFVKSHGRFVSEEAAETAFTVHERERMNNKESLIVKHCKKQQM